MVCWENTIVLNMPAVDFQNYYLQIILIARIAVMGSIIMTITIVILTTDIIEDFAIASSTTIAKINL